MMGMGDDETILRYSTFEVNGALRLGLISKNGVLDLHKAHEWFSWTSSNAGALSASTYASMEAFLRNREAAHSAVRVILESVMETPEAHDELFHGMDEVKLKPPIPNPQKAMISGPSWKSYVRDSKVPDFIFVLKPPTALVGDGDEIVFPREYKEIVTEVELALVVGRSGRYISQEEAWEHIAGFTVFNDVTDMGLYSERTPRAVIRAKSYDTFASVGPCLVMQEDIGDTGDLELRLRLNGEERVRISTREMLYPMSHFVSSVSEVMTLQPGDIISTGCPLWVPVQPGDAVEAEIENIGVLRNSFVAWSG
jgi:2-keto-4-pentenoate hydratase/2-oxohepta-3-ene-1,7-dioic acid hydratase in catechol pathway